MRKAEELPVYLEAFGVPAHLIPELLDAGYDARTDCAGIGLFIAAMMAGAFGLALLPASFVANQDIDACLRRESLAPLFAMLSLFLSGMMLGAIGFLRFFSRRMHRTRFVMFNASFLNKQSDAVTPWMTGRLAERDGPSESATELMEASDAMTRRLFWRAFLAFVPIVAVSVPWMIIAC